MHAVVRPDRRRQGIGTALFDAAEHGPPPRAGTPLQSWVLQAARTRADSQALAPREGSGFVDGNASAAFCWGRGTRWNRSRCTRCCAFLCRQP